ncbi:DUF3558 domain-containing protein [Pseudonocardia hispaniensis]|uniref:DUF3558 domain-containing protein n=1 Tax=Pseudonocardia hispaniensis TaxID=904933 RepID=A0ABW1J8I6_9PSEU
MSRVVRLLALGALLAVAACGQPVTTPAVAGPPGAVPATAAPSAPPTSERHAPRVPHPKDARGIAACELLTPRQLVELGLRPESARPAHSRLTRDCSWSAGEGDVAALLIATDEATDGLESIYLQRTGFAVFEPGEVAGHPSVRANLNPGPFCELWVGVADDRLLWVDGKVGVGSLPDPCERSRRMAAAVLSNLPPLT